MDEPTRRVDPSPPASESETVLGDSSSRPTAPAPPRAPAGEPSPQGRAFGRYILLEALGQGGMGVVWKAWDTELARIVALKGILWEREGDPRVERFMREARLAAKLRHRHIVSVHDVGVHEGQHYFTCDYVAGRTLAERMEAGAIPIRQAVDWIREVAEALAYAHEQGVIHRDVKPRNIMIGEDGTPYVMDFGLAREADAGSDLTVTGELVGTPAYMSPEQAAGRTHDVDAASDQFSLGSTLYRVLAGRLPFDAPDVRGLLNAITDTDPSPPSRWNPRVHRDLDVLCLKALEKDPPRRYAGMAELAADLRRWIDGEPIHARPASGVERLWRKAVRHWAVTLPSAAALLVALLFGLFALRTHFKDVREQAEALARETRLRAEAQAALDERNTAYGRLEKSFRVSEVAERWTEISSTMRRLEATFYDDRLSLEEKRRLGQPGWEEVERFLADTPPDSASQATALAFAGWARRLAGFPEEAEERMERASRLDPDIPYGTLLRAMVLFTRYVEEQPLPGIQSGGDSGLRLKGLPQETAGMRQRRTQVERLLSEAEQAAVWGRLEVEAYKAALAAMFSWQRGGYEAAELALSRAIAGRTLAWMRADLLLARGKVRYLRLEFDRAREDVEEVVRLRDGDASVRCHLGQVLHGQAEVAAVSGKDPRPAILAAIDAFTEALGRLPGYVAALGSRGDAHLSLGQEEALRGLDPGPSLARAMEDHDEALRANPDLLEEHNNRGIVFLTVGRVQAARGMDPRPSYQRAIDDFGMALQGTPDPAVSHLNRGNAHVCWAEWEAARGLDPRERFRRGIQDLDQALTRDPGIVVGYKDRGSARRGLGEAEAARGGDPLEPYQEAIADFDEAITRNPGFAEALAARGCAQVKVGEVKWGRGQDPRPDYDKGIADLGEALARNPATATTWVDRGVAWLRRGQAEHSLGEDPRGSYKKGLADFDEGLKRNPADAQAHKNRGNAHYFLGEAATARGEDPRESYQRAIEDFGEALERNRGDAEAYGNRGLVHHALGAAEAKRGSDPRESYGRAIADYAAALRANPELVAALNNRSTAYVSLGKAQAGSGEDPRESFRRAIADCEEALKRRPGVAQVHCSLGIAWYHLGESQAKLGEDPAESYQNGIAAFQRALEINANLWQAHMNLGLLHESMGSPERAIPCYEAALALVGDNHPALRRRLEEARRQAGKSEETGNR